MRTGKKTKNVHGKKNSCVSDLSDNCLKSGVIAFIAFCITVVFFFLKRKNLGWLDNVKQRKKSLDGLNLNSTFVNCSLHADAIFLSQHYANL